MFGPLPQTVKAESIAYGYAVSRDGVLVSIEGPWREFEISEEEATITAIGSGAFAECESLERVVIPSGVTRIESGAFYGCSSLSSVTIPSSVKVIEAEAFTGTPWLEQKRKEREDHLVIVNQILIDGHAATGKVTIPADVTSISGSAFGISPMGGLASELTSVVIPSSVANIANGSFAHCHSLEKVTIKKGVKVIETGAFFDCTALKSVTLPAGMTTLESGAFYECSKLANIKIASSVKTIGGNVFYGTPWLEQQRTESKDHLVIVNKILIDGTMAAGKVTIPAGVTRINQGAFYENPELTAVTIPASVKVIEKSAFDECPKLKSVTIKKGVKTIEDYAFWGCKSLTSLKLPTSVKTLGEAVFQNCTALTIKVPKALKGKVPDSVFAGCKKVTYY